MQTTETEMRSRSFPQYVCNTTRKKRTQESSHRKNYGNPRYSTTRIYMHNQHAIYKRHTNSLSLLYTHTLTNTRAPAGRVHEKAFPHFHTDQIIHRSSPEKEMQPKTRFSFQERTTTWTYAVCICTFPPTAIFHFSFTRCRSSCRAATGTASTRA